MIPNQPQSSKICTLDELLKHRANARALGEKVVHCHGCFDIVHPGHIKHLEHAKQLGDRLLVTLTADEFVNKGDARPMFEQSLRAQNLAALSCVDWVLINPAPTAAELLHAVQPDVYVKGAEYESNNDPRFAAERDAVENHHGRVVFTSGDIVFSSTALIDAIRRGSTGDDPFAPDTHADSIANLHRNHDLSSLEIERVLDSMDGQRLIIVGESIIDTYVDCAWPEVTGEAPILSLRPHRRVSFDGGAAVIALHAAALGAIPHLVTPLPRTDDARALKSRLEHAGVVVEAVETETPLPHKERLMVGREKLVKLDHSQPIELDHRTRLGLIDTAKKLGSVADGAILVDFGLGMLGPKLTKDLFGVLDSQVRVLSGDVSGPRASLQHMTNATWLTPSERELRGSLTSETGSLPAVAAKLMQMTNAQHIAITMADEGMVIFTHRGRTESLDGQPAVLSSEHIPALNRTPMDTIGCGDALLTLSTLAQMTGADTCLSAYIGSLAAAVCGSKLGNHACQPEEMLRLARYVESGIQSNMASPVAPAFL